MNFKNIPVIIDGHTIYATSASIQESYPVTSAKSLGTQGGGFTGFFASDRKRGSVSLSYYLQESDQDIRDLTGIHLINGSVGPIAFDSGVLTNYSLQAQPFQLIEVNADFEFFNGISEGNFAGTYSADDFSLMNGKMTSGVDGVGFNNKLLSYNLSISQSIEPTYVAGNQFPSGYSRTDGKISVQISSTGIANDFSWPCQDNIDTSISLGSTCGDSFVISFSGMAAESVSYNTQVGDNMISNVSLVKFF